MANVKIDALSDTELLNLSRRGDSAAFGVLWERHRLAGIVAARNIASTLDPDDLVSDAYLKIFELVRDGRGPTGAFRPYLYKVISSVAADTYRSPEHSNSDLTEVPDLTEAGPWEDGAFDINAAARAFESLPERWQAALWYSEVEGLAPRQIAPILGMSANAVSALSARAKEGLQSAWVETHINMQLADEACGTTRSHLQRYQLGKLTSRRSREVAAHLETCDSCAAAAAEFKILNKQLALVLATIFLGGAPAAALLKSLGATTVVAGAGAATIVSPGGVGTPPPPTGGGSAGSSASGAATAGTGAGIGVGVIALVTTATLAVAAVGGILIANTLEGNSAGTPATETASVESEPDSTTSSGPDEARTDEASTLLPPDAKDATESSLTSRASGPSSDRGEQPARPLPPPPTIPPPVVPPNPPAEIIAGYQCYVPHIDTGEFELRGRASLPDTLEIGLTGGGASILQVNAATDRTWSSGPLPGLNDFLAGSKTAEVRLISGTASSLWESATVTQCAGTGPTVVTTIGMSEVCFLDPLNISLYGQLSEYGVIFARHVVNGSSTPIVDTQFDGVQDPIDPSIIWSGIYTGASWTGPAPHDWLAPLSLTPIIGTAADYNAGNSGRLELRVQTPDNRTSTWMHVDQLIEYTACSF